MLRANSSVKLVITVNFRLVSSTIERNCDFNSGSGNGLKVACL